MKIQAYENSTIRSSFKNTVLIMGLMHTAVLVMYSDALEKMSVSYITSHTDLNNLIEKEIENYFEGDIPFFLLLWNELTRSEWEAIFIEVSQSLPFLRQNMES